MDFYHVSAFELYISLLVGGLAANYSSTWSSFFLQPYFAGRAPCRLLFREGQFGEERNSVQGGPGMYQR